MNAITEAALLELARAEGDHLASIYLPLQLGGAQSQQNPIRLKNLLRSAERRLLETGMNETDAHRFLKPASELLDRPTFWQGMGAGLVLLLGRGAMQVFRLTRPCGELAIVGRRFYIVPMLAAAHGNTPYFVLAVSQNRVRLFRGSEGGLVEETVAGLPENLVDALGYDEPEGMYQVHDGQPRFAGKEGLVFHGQGGAVDVAKQEVESFFRSIDRAVTRHLADGRDPLVFAGVDYLFPIYRNVNGYSQLSAAHISGNPDELPLAELHARAQTIIGDVAHQRYEAVAARYWNSVAHGRTLNRMEAIVAAAYAGQVDVLFVDPTVVRLGTFDPANGEAREAAFSRPDSEDLVNLSAVYTLRRNGQVVPAELAHVPGGGVMAAVLGYVPQESTAISAVAGGP